MSHRISDRAEYDDREYAELRITEIQSILENEDLTPEDEAEYKAEQAMLEKILNPITIKTIDGCNFTDQYEAMTGIYKLMNNITASQPNLRVYAIVTTDMSAIVTSDGDIADANENAIVAEQVASDDGNHNAYKGQESICPLCGGHLDYIDSSPDYLFWHCPTCHADGKEGKSYTPDGDVEFDGYHYDIHHHPEDLPDKIKPVNLTQRESETAIKALLESFIDNYINDCCSRNMSNDEIHAELCQALAGIFKPGHLTHLGYHDYELTNTQSRKGIHKLIVFKSETDDCIDMILDVQNWDENFQHEVDVAVHKWQNSDDEYSIVITEHLESVGYIFTLRDDCEVYSDYS